MIYARLHGRLGNQMFQYAAARGLAARLDVPFALDTRRAVYKGEGVLTRVFDLDLTTPQDLPPAQHERPLAYYIWRSLGLAPKIYREIGSMGHHHNFLIRVTSQEPRREKDRDQLRLTMTWGDINTYTILIPSLNAHEHITQHTVMFANNII